MTAAAMPIERAAVASAAQPAWPARDPDAESPVGVTPTDGPDFLPRRARVVLDETIGLPAVDRGLYQ